MLASTPAALVTVMNPPWIARVPLLTNPPPVVIPSVRVAAPPIRLLAPRTPVFVGPIVATRLLKPAMGAWATKEAAEPAFTTGNDETLPTPASVLKLVIVPVAPLLNVMLPPDKEMVPRLIRTF